MKKVFLFIFPLLLPLRSISQRYYRWLDGKTVKIDHIRNIPDSISNLITPTGFIINDTIIKCVYNRQVDSVVNSHPGWRLPTLKDLSEIFKTTFDERLLQCALYPGTYRTSEYEIGDVDTMRISAIMYGWKIEPRYTEFDWMGHEKSVDIILIKKINN